MKKARLTDKFNVVFDPGDSNSSGLFRMLGLIPNYFLRRYKSCGIYCLKYEVSLLNVCRRRR